MRERVTREWREEARIGAPVFPVRCRPLNPGAVQQSSECEFVTHSSQRIFVRQADKDAFAFLRAIRGRFPVKDSCIPEIGLTPGATGRMRFGAAQPGLLRRSSLRLRRLEDFALPYK